MVRLVCCAPLLALGMAPILESWRWHYASSGALLALVIVALVVNWERRLEDGAAGELSAGQAFGAGLFAMIVTAILADGNAAMFFTAAGVAAVSSLALQAVAWFVPLRGLRFTRGHRGTEPGGKAAAVGERIGAAAEVVGQRVSQAVARTSHVRTEADAETVDRGPDIPMALAVEQDSLHARLASSTPLPMARSTAVRAMWSVLGFLFLAGAVVSFLSTVFLAEMRHRPEDRAAALVVCMACVTSLAFVLRKTSLRRRATFWGETLRPFLLSLTAFGVLAPAAALWSQTHVDGEFRVAGYTAMILSGVLFFLLLVVFRGSDGGAAAPFLVDGGEDDPEALEGHAVASDGSADVTDGGGE